MLGRIYRSGCSSVHPLLLLVSCRAEIKNSTFCIRSIDLNISWFASAQDTDAKMHIVIRYTDVHSRQRVHVFFFGNLWFGFLAGKSFVNSRKILPSTLGKSTAVLARCIRPCRRSVKVLTWAYPHPEKNYPTASQGLGLALKGSQPENNWPSQWNAARLSGWKSLEGILVAVRMLNFPGATPHCGSTVQAQSTSWGWKRQGWE